MTSSLRSLTLIFYFFGAFAFFPSAVRGLSCAFCSDTDPNISCEKSRPSKVADCKAGEKCYTASNKGQPVKYGRGCLKTDIEDGCEDRTTGLKCYHCTISDCVKPKLKECPAPFGFISKFLCMKTTQNGKDIARGCIPDLGQGVQCVKGQGRDQTCLCNTDGCNNDSFGGGSRLGGFSLLWALAALTHLFLIYIGNIGMDSFSA